VTYLNEFPTVIQGNFDPAFLDLPDEILITVMRDHQKYFALEKKTGELAPHFLAVINLAKDPMGMVRAGHERVLGARFADARFFWQSDQKCRLGDILPRLERVTYESRLGSYREKVERLRSLARWFAEQWFNLGISEAHVADADRAAELAKCDLATEMVREFPELQGIVGGLYARAQGESAVVADAVYDHYLPASLEDPSPRNLIGCAVALADKLDAVAGCFAVGIIPTGSSDPFALRRAAQGIVKIILDRKLTVSLSLSLMAAGKALHSYPPKIALPKGKEAQILEFILDRARFFFRERLGFAYDEVNAVFRAGADDLIDAQKRLEALRSIRKSRNFEPLAVSFKRIRKILEKADGLAVERQGIKTDLFEHPAERDLYSAVREAAAKVHGKKRAGHYREALEVIALINPIRELTSQRDLKPKARLQTLDAEVTHYEPELQCAKPTSKLRTVIHEVLDLFTLSRPQILWYQAESAAKHVHFSTVKHAKIDRNKQTLMRVHYQRVGAVASFQHPSHLGHHCG